MAKKKVGEELEATLAPRGQTAMAIPDAEVDDAFGGTDTAMPIDVAWPEIKLTKTDDFKMPDGTKVKELIGNIVYVKRSRACWLAKYDGNDNPPDCASDNCHAPNDDIEQPFSRRCGEKLCSKATWRKETEDGNERNIMDCKESLNMILLLDGMTVPRFMRVRSYSFNRKSPLAAFFTDALEPLYAYRGKFQTVKVKLTLEEIKVNGFDTSMLNVEKISTLEGTDPLLPVLIKMFKKAEAEFVVVHTEETANGNGQENDSSQEYDGGEFTDPDDDNAI